MNAHIHCFSFALKYSTSSVTLRSVEFTSNSKELHISILRPSCTPSSAPYTTQDKKHQHDGVLYLELLPLGPLLESPCCTLILVKWSDMFITTNGCSETLTLLGVLVRTELGTLSSTSIFAKIEPCAKPKLIAAL